MSWLMYATRSTMRTIFPSSVSGSRSPVCVRMPSTTSWVRLSRRAMRADCSLCRKPAVARSSSSAASPAWPNGGCPSVVAEPDRLGEILVQPQRPRDDARDAGRLERVRHPRAVVVARGVDEDLRLALQAAERLRVQDPVAVALERRPHAALVLGPLAAARLVRAHGERRQRAAPRARGSARRRRRQLFPASSGIEGQRSFARRRSDDDRDGAAVGAPRGAGHVRARGRSRGRRSRRRSPPARRAGRAAGRRRPSRAPSSRSPCWSASPPSPSHASVAVGPGRDRVAADAVLRVEVGDEPREARAAPAFVTE